MRSPRFALIACALAASISGCATWQQPAHEPSWSTSARTPGGSANAQEVVRYQASEDQMAVDLWGYGGNPATNGYAGDSDHFRQPMQPSQASAIPTYGGGSAVQPAQYGAPLPGQPPPGSPSLGAPSAAPGYGSPPPGTAPPGYGAPAAPPNGYQPIPDGPPPGYAVPFPQWNGPTPSNPPTLSPWTEFTTPNAPYQEPTPPQNPFTDPNVMNAPLADIIVNLQETQTGRLMVGAAVNSDAGVTGQIVIDEKNFDWLRVPTTWSDWVNGTAFRGAGQGFRLEALPGREVQRYMFQFTEPYLFDTNVSFNFSAFLYDRNFFDWDEQRIGGRIGFGYRITPDMSISAKLRAEQVTLTDPRVPGVPELDAALGENELYGLQVSLVNDTRDIPFAPTQGYFFEASFEQVLGSFDYSRGVIDYRRYFLVTERPDGSGRHVLGFSSRAGITGSQTPIYENFFAGGYATLRGFDFRGATPKVDDVAVGGELSLLGSVEYLFPITADDMLKGIVFCDYGTIEETTHIDTADYRVALGAGLRIFVPAMGPAPIALDFAVPIAREDTDDIRQFSFFMGVSR